MSKQIHILLSILGPPGSGKTTQSSLLTQTFSLAHLSIGAILRAEAADPNSPWAAVIAANIASGQLGSKEMSAEMLGMRIAKGDEEGGVRTVLLDGFPRRVDQAEYFEAAVGQIECVVVLECSKDALVKRLAARKRADDTEETIRARIKTFDESTAEVVERYEKLGKVVRVNSNGDVRDVFTKVVQGLEDAGVVLEKR